MELQTYEYLLAYETANIHKLETELAQLGQFRDGKWLFGGTVPSEIQERVKFLLTLIHKKHALTGEYQNHVSALKKEVATTRPSM